MSPPDTSYPDHDVVIVGDGPAGRALGAECVVAGIDRASGPAPLPHQKHVNAIAGGLSRLSATQQKQNLDCIIHALKSDEVKRQLRDRLNEDLADAG